MTDRIYRFAPLDQSNIQQQIQEISEQKFQCELRCLKNTTLWLSELALCYDQTYFLKISKHDCLKDKTDLYDLVKCCFNDDQFVRCCSLLENHLNTNSILDYMYYYSKFKSILKFMYQNNLNVEDDLVLHKLSYIERDISEYICSNQPDPYILYIHGLVFKKLKLEAKASKCFIQSLELQPSFYAAWFELSTIYDLSRDDELPEVWMRNFFDVKYFIAFNKELEADSAATYLVKQPNFCNFHDLLNDLAYINTLRKNCHYALEIFQKLHKSDPTNLGHVEYYSNLLFIEDKKSELSALSKHAMEIDKFHPGSLKSMGNFLSLRGEHAKALSYFQNALKLEPANTQIMILIAHEFVNLNNFHAASKFYCKAIQTDSKCYKAIYNQGQLFETFKAPKYAQIFYELALKWNPNDSRIFVGLGQMKEDQDRLLEAKNCYYRAHCIGDSELTALFRLARVCDKLKQRDEAATAFQLFIYQVNNQGIVHRNTLGEAYRYLANYLLDVGRDIDRARFYAEKVINYSSLRIEGEELLHRIDRIMSSNTNIMINQPDNPDAEMEEPSEYEDEGEIYNDADLSHEYSGLHESPNNDDF